MTHPDACPETPLLAAAILDDGSQDVDALLMATATRLRAAGRRVRGLVMTYPDGRESCAGRMVLVDIETGEATLVSQDLGHASNACRADPQGFALASASLRKALETGAELVVSNRFGGLEAEGGGFAAELLALMAQGVPLLTAVPVRHRAAWQTFTGGATVLPPDAEAVQAWLDQALASRAQHAPAN
jgi:hypothetical protein